MHILGTIASSITGSKLTAFESIQTVSVGAGGTTSITFSNIPQTYAHLQVRGIARGTWVNAGGLVSFFLFMNNQNGAGYVAHHLTGDGSTAGRYVYPTTPPGSGIELTDIPNNNALANTYNSIVLDILDYRNASKYKTTRALIGRDFNGTGQVSFSSGVFLETPAVTSLRFAVGADSFAQYSHFALYGIKAAS